MDHQSLSSFDGSTIATREDAFEGGLPNNRWQAAIAEPPLSRPTGPKRQPTASTFGISLDDSNKSNQNMIEQGRSTAKDTSFCIQTSHRNEKRPEELHGSKLLLANEASMGQISVLTDFEFGELNNSCRSSLSAWRSEDEQPLTDDDYHTCFDGESVSLFSESGAVSPVKSETPSVVHSIASMSKRSIFGDTGDSNQSDCSKKGATVMDGSSRWNESEFSLRSRQMPTCPVRTKSCRHLTDTLRDDCGGTVDSTQHCMTRPRSRSVTSFIQGHLASSLSRNQLGSSRQLTSNTSIASVEEAIGSTELNDSNHDIRVNNDKIEASSIEMAAPHTGTRRETMRRSMSSQTVSTRNVSRRNLMIRSRHLSTRNLSSKRRFRGCLTRSISEDRVLFCDSFLNDSSHGGMSSIQESSNVNADKHSFPNMRSPRKALSKRNLSTRTVSTRSISLSSCPVEETTSMGDCTIFADKESTSLLCDSKNTGTGAIGHTECPLPAASSLLLEIIPESKDK